MEPFREKFNEVASLRVRTTITVDCIAEQEKISAGEADYEEALEQLSQRSGVGMDEVRKFYGDQERKADVRRRCCTSLW